VPVAVILLSDSSSSDKPTGNTEASSEAAGLRTTGDLAPVPYSKVKGVGDATVRLNGDVASVALNTNGLVNSQHAMHIHAGARGECPTGAAARLHGGHRVIATHDGVAWYGPPVAALTLTGDATPKSILAFKRFPTVGNIRYSRQIRVGPVVASYIRNKNAVVVVHGIDYNGNGTYDLTALDRSDLKRSLPGEITAPALCGALVPVPQATGSGTRTGSVQSYTASLQIDDAASGWLCHLSDASEGQRKRA
jgi:hypothetical protein